MYMYMYVLQKPLQLGVQKEHSETLLITLIGGDYQDCHENEMATPLNVLRFESLHVYLHQRVDFSTYEGLPVIYKQWQS